MKKKLISILTVMVMVLSFGSVLPEGVRGALDTQITASAYTSEGIVDLARTYLNKTNYNGLCLKYVQDVFQAAGVGGYRYGAAWQAADAWCTHTDRNIPVGACVFFSRYFGQEYRTNKLGNGHIEIYTGDGKIIGTGDGKAVHERKMNDYYWKYYIGWGWYNGVEPQNPNPSEPVPAHAEDANISDGRYNLVNVGSGYNMNYNWGSGNNNGSGAAMIMSKADGSPEQIFTLEHQGGGKYELHINHSDGGVVNVFSGSPTVGDKITRFDDNNNDTQRFYITPVGSDEYIIQNAANPNVVIGAPNTEWHAKLQLCTYSSSNPLIRWKLTALDPPEPPKPETKDLTITISGGGGEKIGSGEVMIGNGSDVYTANISDGGGSIALPSGAYQLTTYITGYIGREANIAVESLDFAVHIEVHHPGDINGDGLIDIDDALLVINNVNGIAPITDEYDLKVANVSDTDFSGVIDIEDAVAIIRHINGEEALY